MGTCRFAVSRWYGTQYAAATVIKNQLTVLHLVEISHLTTQSSQSVVQTRKTIRPSLDYARITYRNLYVIDIAPAVPPS